MRSHRHYMPVLALAVSSQQGFSNVESTDDLANKQREYESNIEKKKDPSDCYPTFPEVNVFASPYEKPYGKSFRHSFLGKSK